MTGGCVSIPLRGTAAVSTLGPQANTAMER
jgi:hypothetical protein